MDRFIIRKNLDPDDSMSYGGLVTSLLDTRGPPSCEKAVVLKDTPKSMHRRIVMASISMAALSPKSSVLYRGDLAMSALKHCENLQAIQQIPMNDRNFQENITKTVYDIWSLKLKRERQKYGSLLPNGPERVLDAPALRDDFYLKLIDWGPCHLLAVALGATLYIWEPVSGQAKEIFTCPSGNYIASLKWITTGGHVIAAGLSDGRLEIWDVELVKRLRTILHDSLGVMVPRIGALAWNKNILSSGNRQGAIYHTDVRQSRSYFRKIGHAHMQEICGLTWSPDGLQLASGGNDNLVNIFELRERGGKLKASANALFCFKAHQAAVKALAWCPYRSHLLASGGGTADQTIRLWQTTTGSQYRCSQRTGSAVTSLLWSPESYEELLSTHGASVAQSPQIYLWHAASLTQLAHLSDAHAGRILTSTCSPDASTIVTAGADENLHFWQIYNARKGVQDNLELFSPHLPLQVTSPPPLCLHTPKMKHCPMSPSRFVSLHHLNSPVLSPTQRPSPASIKNIYLNLFLDSPKLQSIAE
jgi:WD40 repeat protein